MTWARWLGFSTSFQVAGGATKALKRFAKDADTARGSDLAAIDASQLRIARQQLHQAVVRWKWLDSRSRRMMLRAMEAAVQKFVQQPELCSQDAVAKIEYASFALTEYLEGVLADKPVSAVSLFPQYRNIQELGGPTVFTRPTCGRGMAMAGAATVCNGRGHAITTLMLGPSGSVGLKANEGQGPPSRSQSQGFEFRICSRSNRTATQDFLADCGRLF